MKNKEKILSTEKSYASTIQQTKEEKKDKKMSSIFLHTRKKEK